MTVSDRFSRIVAFGDSLVNKNSTSSREPTSSGIYDADKGVYFSFYNWNDSFIQWKLTRCFSYEEIEREAYKEEIRAFYNEITNKGVTSIQDGYRKHARDHTQWLRDNGR